LHPVCCALKLTPSHHFISELATSSSFLPFDDSVMESADYLLRFTAYDVPTKHVSPFAAFVTEHYFVSILASQVVGAAATFKVRAADASAPRYSFVCFELTASSLRCLAFLASNIKLRHMFLPMKSTSVALLSTADCLRGYTWTKDAASLSSALHTPQARLQSLHSSSIKLEGYVSPADLLNMFCDERTPYVMTTSDIVVSADVGGIHVKRCALGRMLLMEPFLFNAVSFFLHDASCLQQLPRFASVSSNSACGVRVELGRCSGLVSASFLWDGPSVADCGLKHHPSVFCFASYNAGDCELSCLSLLMTAAELGHGWFTLGAGGGSQFFSARGCMLALADDFSRAAPLLRNLQQPGQSYLSDSLLVALQTSSSRSPSSDAALPNSDQCPAPRTPRSKHCDTADVASLSPQLISNLQTETSALVLYQYVNQLLFFIYLWKLTFAKVHGAFILLDRGQRMAGEWRHAALLLWMHRGTVIT
jgi:hypothetical protein